jgi:hypothetical protein
MLSWPILVPHEKLRGIADEPHIFVPGDVPISRPEAGATQTDVPPFEFDPDRHPWLRNLMSQELAQLAVDLTSFICRPSFGARSKRDIELRTFELLREHRTDWTSLGEIADDLAISRSKARSLSLDFQARRVGALGRGARHKLLREFVETWPTALIEYDEERLRLVIDDPFMRDLLKNFAFSRGILIDHSFAPEIQVFKWSAYAALLEALRFDREIRDDDFHNLAADLRRQVLMTASRDALEDAQVQAQLNDLEERAEKVLQTKAEQRREAVKQFLRAYGPAVAGLAGKAFLPGP